ncbi:hypothetical protein MKX01_011427 [Papaver californicum]|nr:hypothetical protein MKX01_011427 [Papaver californicum]
MEPTRKTYQAITQPPPLHSDARFSFSSSSSSSSSSGLNNTYCYTKTNRAYNHQKLMADPLVVHTQLHLKSLALSVNADTLLAKTQHSKPNIKDSEELGKIKQEKVKNEQMEGGERDKKEPIKPPFVTSGDGASVVGRMTKKVSSLNCFSQIELDEFFSRLGARILAGDMLPVMQTQAVGRARNAYNGRDKFSSRGLASTLKREFDDEYGAAWHCIVGTSFGSFVTHSVGGFFVLLIRLL